MSDDITTLQTRSQRLPSDNIPPTSRQRNRLLQVIKEYVAAKGLLPPMPVEAILGHCRPLLAENGFPEKYLRFAAVLFNNQLWWPTVASVGYNRRLLLLPRCLRDTQNCIADIDPIGLICNHCGRCPIDAFSTEAKRLGYAVLIAEGSPVVMSIIESGGIEAVIGVSCLGVLEKVFPYMEAAAVPGIAVPLLNDGCADTSFEHDWVWEAIYQCDTDLSGDRTDKSNPDRLRHRVEGWFEKDALAEITGKSRSDVERIGMDWLACSGKRWRPFLGAAVFCALAEGPSDLLWRQVRQACVAVECFHKASLIHDDIEDQDLFRYGRSTVHAQYGIPVALNAGDYLIGLGYRLLAQLDIEASPKSQALSVAAAGHCRLCTGQGDELKWRRNAVPLAPADVIDIFRDKTAPAFEVALRTGAVMAGRDDELRDIFAKYGDAVGIAYQIRDDMEDWLSQDSLHIAGNTRLSLLWSLAWQKASAGQKKLLEQFLEGTAEKSSSLAQLRQIISEHRIDQACFDLLTDYKSIALSCLEAVRSVELRCLLRRIIFRIFEKDILMGCCNEYKNRHDNRRRPGG